MIFKLLECKLKYITWHIPKYVDCLSKIIYNVLIYESNFPVITLTLCEYNDPGA